MAKKSKDKTAYSTSALASDLQRRRGRAEAERLENNVRGEKEFYQLRNFWAKLLAVALVASILFQFVLATAVGLGWLHFAAYQTFLNIIAGENFIQVVGLCTIVVSFLFPKR